MATKYNITICLRWIFMLLAALDTIRQSCVEGLRTLDENNFGPKPKGTMRTIEVPEDSDIIDCVDIYKQPALINNPRIKKLQMAPSKRYPSLFNRTKNPLPNLIQNWHKYGECPKGTVPIRRTWKNDTVIHRKNPNDDPDVHEYASAIQQGSTYYGAGAIFSIWNPQVRGPGFSLAQLWIVSGRRSPPKNTIEAGWMVYPGRPDSQTRLFTYWTATDYERGCYNTDCPDGFLQTDHSIALGTVLTTSTYDGDPKELHIDVVRDVETKDWWLTVQNREIGYFPASSFTNMEDGADLKVEFGGEIINTEVDRHTATQMGSGHFPQEGFKKASYVRNAVIFDEEYDVFDASLGSFVSKPGCYDLKFGQHETPWFSNFFYGGPGYSPDRCP